MSDKKNSSPDLLRAAQDDFVTQWGAIGSAWGINRTMAQIHALLLSTQQALTTDEVMEELKISRGNAHSNLRELVGWGLIKSVIRKGERKELFEAEKDVWKMFCTIVKERKRREIEPALEVLKSCYEKTKPLKGSEANHFNKQIKELSDFVSLANQTMERIAQAQKSQVMPMALKLLK